MNVDFVNIVTIMAVVITAVCLVRTILEVRAEKRESAVMKAKLAKEMTDYEKILRATYGIEKEREKNQGKHFEDESVYLNRAKNIRESSPFFTWVNEK